MQKHVIIHVYRVGPDFSNKILKKKILHEIQLNPHLENKVTEAIVT